MSDIFISYAHEDRKTAQRMAEALEAGGWSVWSDARLNAGEVWDEVIERELAAARCVIVLWSKISVQSRWVREEASRGLERQILVPVRIENVQPPLPFGRIQTADLINWKGRREHPGFKKLMADVTAIIGPPPSPPSDGNNKKVGVFQINPWLRWLAHSVATIKHYLAAIAHWRPRKWHLAIAGGIALLVACGIGYSLYKSFKSQEFPSTRVEPPLQRRTFETDAHRIVAKVMDFSMAGESARLSIQLLANWDDLMGEHLCVNPKEARLVDESTGQEWKAAGFSHSNNCQMYFSRDKNMYWMSFQIGQDLQTTFTAVIPGLAEPIKKLELR